MEFWSQGVELHFYMGPGDLLPHLVGIQEDSYGYYEKLGGGFKYFYFQPYLGKIPILTNIFQMGWNHQLGKH